MSDSLFRIRSFMMKKKQESTGIYKPIEQRRAEADGAMIRSIRLPEGTVAENVDVAGRHSLWVRAAGVAEGSMKTVLYYHGGGFFSGSPETHTGLAAAISQASGARVLLAGYRLAPEFLYPAAHDDALAAFRWLIASGVPAGDIALAGDSAGGMLALSTLMALRDSGGPMPAAAALLSPWLDIVDFNGDSYSTKAALDPMVDADSTSADAGYYFISEANRRQAAMLKREMNGLPPMLIQVGDQEVLMSDSLTLAEKAQTAGVEVTLEVWPELWHIFQALTAILPEAVEAVEHIGSFLRAKLNID